MSLNDTPRSDRIHIAFFGRRNAGKSSLLNAVTGQNLAIVSPVEGTTTDPVYKSMELLPLGPVVVIDTPGLDDNGELGLQRVKKARQVMNKTDLALLVVDGEAGLLADDQALQLLLTEKKIPFLTVMTKSDLLETIPEPADPQTIWVSTSTGHNIHELKERLGQLLPQEESVSLVRDLVAPLDFVILVVPIDKAAPKGRLILPQQQTIRELLEAGAASIVVRDHELKQTLAQIGKRPSLVITDSQAFAQVSADTPDDIALTSFSILFARSKGSLTEAVAGLAVLSRLQDGDKILIAEGCTHHRQCDDIGTVKLPRWISQYTGKQLEYIFSSGTGYPEDLSPYRLIVHCGGCMVNTREMKYRIAQAKDQNIPITNYGILIAHTQGILRRSIELFPDIVKLLDKA
ncbi:MAG: [FeFe] hydrogenase H-cluster maturation GTPase HydF [Lachnospiraceae bacterium]